MPRKAVVKRPRNAAVTREAILASARQAFTRLGYDGAGVREIAKDAGVTATLVNRYFGTKERLFAEVIAGIMSGPTVIRDDILKSASPGESLAAAILGKTRHGAVPTDGFLVMARSASSDAAAGIGREQIEKNHQKRLTEALGGEYAAQRAAVAISLIAGLQIMRQVVGLSALGDTKTAALVKVLGPVFQLLIDGERARA